MTDLAGFLNQAAARPVVWGAWDCHLWLADWVLARSGIDPAATMRGRYRTARGALRILKREGGSESLVARLVEAAGLSPVDPSAAQTGDVGLLPVQGVRGVEFVGGLFTGSRWAVLGYPAGIIVYPVSARSVWRI